MMILRDKYWKGQSKYKVNKWIKRFNVALQESYSNLTNKLNDKQTKRRSRIVKKRIEFEIL
jgi:hypothetical protein